MTICNNRGDTPLHNAARWNHPELVNELLLYGASYTATNNSNRMPGDLTSDDAVHDLIWKAGHGIIAVGSYSPLNRATPNESPLGNGGGSGRGLGSSGGSSSSGGKNSYFGKLDRKKVKQDQVFVTPDHRSGSHDQTTISPDQTIISPDRRSGSHDWVTTSPDRRSGSHDRATTSPDHRSGSHDRISTSPDIIEEEAGPEPHDYVVIENPMEHRPLGMQQGAEVNFLGQSSDDELFNERQLDKKQKPHPKEEESLQASEPSQKDTEAISEPKGEEPEARPHLANEPSQQDMVAISEPKGEESEAKPHLMRTDDKLRNLLLSIESFDRYKCSTFFLP